MPSMAGFDLEVTGYVQPDDPTGKPLLSWRVAVLPYLDLDLLHAQFKLDEPWDGPSWMSSRSGRPRRPRR